MPSPLAPDLPSESGPEPHHGDFWRRIEALVREHPVVIDRPAGSRHPRYLEFIYPLDYGYLRGTSAADGNGIDTWIGSIGRAVTGVICTVDTQKMDTEVKILLGCTREEMEIVLAAHNAQSQSGILILREAAPADAR
jgi:inorganic pyrophosphatase